MDDQCSAHIETGQLISRANQLFGFPAKIYSCSKLTIETLEKGVKRVQN